MLMKMLHIKRGRMALSLILLSTVLQWLPEEAQAQATSRKVTNPRQNRTNYDGLDPDDFKEMMNALAEFQMHYVALLQDFGKPCDVTLHNEFVWGGTKSLFSGNLHEGFSTSGRWHNKICNFFKYLDCVSSICECGDESRYKLKLEHFPEDDLINDPLKKHLKHKRRCRSQEGELCNFVRMEKDETFPGVNFTVPDYFKCADDFVCKTVVDSTIDPITGLPIVSERCQNQTRSGTTLLTARSSIALVVIAMFARSRLGLI